MADLRVFLAANENVPQKEFAVEKVSSLPVAMRGTAFTARKGIDAGEAVRSLLIAKATSQSSVDEYRALHGAKWNVSGLDICA